MKILLVGNYFYPEHIGGIEVVSYYLVKHYREQGHQVKWIAADVPPKFRRTRDGDVTIKAWNITEEKLGFPYPIPSPWELKKLLFFVIWSDIVHLHDTLYPINCIVFLYAKILKKSILITQHAKIIPYSQFYKRIFQWLAYNSIGKIMFHFADKLVFVTTNVRDSMAKFVSGTHHEVVRNGINFEFFSPLPDDERAVIRERITGLSSNPIILFVGRMVERKGVHLLRQIIERHEEWHWVLVGRSDDFEPSNWNLSNLTYYNYVEEERLRELYASADVLLHPSVGEGITLIVAECMSCGTPVIISEESLYEIGDDDRQLFFSVEPNSIDIENTLVQVLSDIEKLKILRKRIRTFVLVSLSWAEVSKQYLNIMQDIHS